MGGIITLKKKDRNWGVNSPLNYKNKIILH